MDSRPCRISRCLRACLAATALITGLAIASDEPVCVYVSSNHKGNSWSDRVEKGLRDTLGSHCEIVQYNMDSKRRKSDMEKVAAAEAALALIDQLDPDIVLTSDDNAARYLIAPHLLDTDTPVVFSGVNWTVEGYGFPARNVTGIVEVTPLEPMISQAITSVPHARRAAYLSALTLSEQKNFDRIEHAAKEAGIELFAFHTETFEDWKVAFELAQSYDFVIIGSHSGIDNWDLDTATRLAEKKTRRLSVTNYDWMMPVTSLGYTTIPEEHGEWAATSAIAILTGTRPASIPIVTNRKWDTWINQTLLDASGAEVSETLTKRAKRHP